MRQSDFPTDLKARDKSLSVDSEKIVTRRPRRPRAAEICLL
jgi:hypothetical protein